MYKVYCDGVAIYDLFSPDLMLLEPTLELELNSPGTFEFTIPLDHPYYDLPQEMLSRVWVTKDDEEIFRGRVIEEEIDWYKRKKVYCEGELAFLNDSIQRPAEYHDMTVRDYFKTLIDEHNSQVEEDKQFEIGYVLVEDSNDSLYRYTNYNSTMTEMKEDLIDDLGGYIRVRNQNGHRYLDYINIEDYGARNNQAIRFGINLLDFSQTMNVSDIATVIIPLGERLEESPIEALDMRLTIESVNDGSDAIESEEAVETYGRIVQTVIWDDVTQASNLLEKGKKYLSDYQWDPLVLEVTPVDLHDSDPDTESFNLGDQIRVISSPHGLDRYFPLSAMTIHLDSLDQNTFTLGTEIAGKTLTTIVRGTIDQVSDVEKEITPTQIILNQAKEQASNLINAATHGYVVLQPNDAPEEILIMDAPNFEDSYRIWRWNMGGLGYGTRESTDEDFFFDTAITMDGQIVADFISTGQLTANIIKTGKIQDVPGNNCWDMDKGTLTISTKQFTLDSSGNAEFSGSLNAASGTFTGNVQARSGEIAGWTITNRAIYRGCTSSSDYDTDGTYIGSHSDDGILYSNGTEFVLISSDVVCSRGRYHGGMTRMISGYFEAYDEDDETITMQLHHLCFRAYYQSYSYWYSVDNDFRRVYLNGSSYTGSDEKLKTNIQPLISNKYDDFFDRLKPKTYCLKESHETHTGFVYQDVIEDLEESGIDPEDSALVEEIEVNEKTHEKVGAIAYNEIIALLVFEVQNLKAEVAELKAKLE